ncbi:hypothetical protein ACQCZM_26720, partial [Escherichia coli]|uniref:hypothetical protein n=1 Tax=Escherichia coli TaxID=562 RepID=UPI003CE6A0D3
VHNACLCDSSASSPTRSLRSVAGAAASGGITLVVMQIRFFFFALELSGVAVHMGSCDMLDGGRSEGTATTHPSQ